MNQEQLHNAMHPNTYNNIQRIGTNEDLSPTKLNDKSHEILHNEEYGAKGK